LVIHTCSPGGWARSGQVDAQVVFEENVKVIEAILPTAKEYAVTICVENLPFRGFSLAPAKEVKKLVRFIDDSNVKICFDTGHANCLGEKAYDTVKLLGNDLACLHVHDNTGGADDRHYIPYQGTIDWQGFTNALGEIGFAGVMSLETIIKRQTPEPMKEQMQRALAQIARHLASKVGE
jgi:sugar phosphate isomerase/epimerase